ncbi:MAG: hypothetical protein JXQ73_22915 [Phycisphaerae bacterium]|nr:hypothetical protein [Phycisphaerae bacterium]
MSMKEIQDKVVATMQKWQKVEDASVASTGRVIAKTGNPIVRLVMEIIQADSQMHHRVQGIIAGSVSTATTTLSPDELEEVWEMVENHIKIEKQTIEMAQELLALIKGKKMVVAEYLLHYLGRDEQKHETMLADLEGIKKGMYPYG